MADNPLREALGAIRESDPRYALDAYLFVCEALQFTTKLLEKPREGPERHVSGTELLEGARRYALQEFGPMARTVLQTWGITRTEDFGEIVFNMVESGIFGRTPTDSRADFAGGYAFERAFVTPYLPRSARPEGE